MAVAVARAGQWLRRRLLEPEYPLTAVEVRAHSVGVVRLQREGQRRTLAAAASLDLAPGTVELSMMQPNVKDAAAFVAMLRAVLERAGVLHGGRVALVLPDPVARIALLKAGDLTGEADVEPDEMVRFHLRKSVPFNVAQSLVAWQRGADSVLVAAIFRPVLESFEEACQAVGLHAGLVELAGLTILDAIESERPPAERLIVNWDEGYVSLFLTRGGWPVLARSIAGVVAADPHSVVREVANTALYFRDRLGGGRITQCVLRSARLPGPEAALVLEEALGFLPELFDPWGPFGVQERGPAAQAVAGAAACVRARAA